MLEFSVVNSFERILPEAFKVLFFYTGAPLN